MIDLLSPVGNFDCLKAAVQNGANSVYFGADLFNARAYASNFNLDDLEKAIIYAKARGVKTNLTLNTLVTDNEFNDAFIELYNARKGDEVHFFISPNAHKIDGYLMNKLKEKQIKYWFEECVVDEDNDMGKCLIAFLGVMISRYPLSGCEFYIVSNDKGYENPVTFIKNTIRGNYEVNYINTFKVRNKDIETAITEIPEIVLE